MADYASELSELMPETPQGSNTAGIGINIKRLVKLRGRFMALMFLALAIPALIAIWILIPAEYVASANLEFQAKIESVMNPNARTDSQRVYDNYVNTQMLIIKSPEILGRFLNDPEKVASVPILAQMDSGKMRFVRSKLEVEQPKYSELVSVSFKDIDADSAVRNVEFVTEAYMAYYEDQALIRGGSVLRTLKESEIEFQLLIDELDVELTELGDLYDLSIADDNSAGNTAKVSPYQEQLAIARSEFAANKILHSTSQKQLERLKARLVDYNNDPMASIYSENIEQEIDLDATVQLTSARASSAQQAYTEAYEKYQPGYRVVKERLEELDRAQAQLLKEKSKVRGRLINGRVSLSQDEVDMAESYMDQASEKIVQISASIEEERQDNLKLSGNSLKITKKKDEIALATQQRNAKTTRINELRLESEGPARVSIVGMADASGAPDMKSRIKMALLTILAFFTLSLLIGVVMEFRDQNIRSEQDVAYVTDLPVLTSVPHAKEDRLPKDVNMATVVFDFPNSMTADRFRQVVARMLQWEHRGRRMQSIAVMSPQHDEGKSVLACNLAIALAQSDRRVLLVDANSRNPSIESNFGMQPAEGLSDMLSGSNLVQDPDRETYVENLYVVGPGLQGSDLIERMASKEMSDFIRGSERLFDYVIVDTPAALFASEAKLLAPVVSGVIVTTGAGKSSFGMLRRCLRSVEESGGNILGVVVNGVRHVTGGYMRQNTDMYYQEKSVQPQKSAKSSSLDNSEQTLVAASHKGRRDDEEI